MICNSWKLKKTISYIVQTCQDEEHYLLEILHYPHSQEDENVL